MIDLGMTVTALVPAERLFPNPWNPNEMDPEMFEKELESIRRFGFVDPLTVRPHPWEKDCYQIIDGEHRWVGGRRLGMTEFPCVVLDVDDATAQELTIVLNETRGKPNSTKLRELVQGLAAQRDQLELQELLPFDRKVFLEMIGQTQEIDFSKLQQQHQEASQTAWVERIFRMPHEAARVLDEAIEKVMAEEDGVQEWRALELIAADYLS